MVWGRFSSAPVDIEKKKNFYEKNPEAFKKVISDRIKFCANLYPDVITEWDVINEPAAEQKFAKILGENAMTEWINLAKKLAPKTLTCTNDYNIIAGYDMQHREDYIKIIEELEKKSAKLDTIGLQAHFGSPIAPAEVLSRIRLFKKFNKDLILTEFTIAVNDEDIKANFVRDMLILTYSIPQVRGLLTWSVEDFYNENWTPNKAGREWSKLVNKTWHTKLNTRTNKNGEFVIKGYKGKYIVNIRVGSKVIRKEFLLDNKKEVTIRL
jgi:GH35 family endo-1,4-beta-xylanase